MKKSELKQLIREVLSETQGNPEVTQKNAEAAELAKLIAEVSISLERIHELYANDNVIEFARNLRRLSKISPDKMTPQLEQIGNLIFGFPYMVGKKVQEITNSINI